ncbi:MAG: hypothetical protein JSR82_09005 [Verrucomicrobia bacterium]|nr:hypothetical protein [Verrucomicrobiota bacterium]
MAQESAPPSRPSWIHGACLGMGIAFGSVAARNGLGFESPALQWAAGAVVAVVVTLVALGLAQMLTKKGG